MSWADTVSVIIQIVNECDLYALFRIFFLRQIFNTTYKFAYVSNLILIVGLCNLYFMLR